MILGGSRDTNPLQQHIRRNLQHNNTQEHELIPHVDRALVDMYGLHKAPC